MRIHQKCSRFNKSLKLKMISRIKLKFWTIKLIFYSRNLNVILKP